MNIILNNQKELTDIMPPQKVEFEFFNFLSEDEECEQEGNNFILSALDENYDNPRIVNIDRNDPITILAIRSTKDFYRIFRIPLTVEVAVGKFTPTDSQGFYFTEKCFARLNYGIDLELISIDFYYNDRVRGQ